MERCILSFKNRSEILELPVPLQIWNGTSGNNTYNFTTLEKGDIKGIGGSKLKTLNIDSFFPNHPYSFLFYKDIKEPWTCYNIIEKWRLSKEPIRVTIVNTEINLMMSIESFEVYKEDGTGDLYFTLELEEYKYLNTSPSHNTNRINSFTGLRERI